MASVEIMLRFKKKDGNKKNKIAAFTVAWMKFLSAWASTLNMGLTNKVDMICLLPVGYGV